MLKKLFGIFVFVGLGCLFFGTAVYIEKITKVLKEEGIVVSGKITDKKVSYIEEDDHSVKTCIVSYTFNNHNDEILEGSDAVDCNVYSSISKGMERQIRYVSSDPDLNILEENLDKKADRIGIIMFKCVGIGMLIIGILAIFR